MPTGCAFAFDGVLVVAGFESGELGLVKARGSHGQFTLPAHGTAIRACTAAAAGSCFVTVGSSGDARLWSEGLESTRIGAGEIDVAAVALSPDGRRFATVGSGDVDVQVWATEGGRLLAQRALADSGFVHAPGGAGGAASCAFSRDGRRLLVGCEDGTLRLLETETLTEHAAILAHGESVIACAVSPDGVSVLTRARGGQIRGFDLTLVEASGRAAGHAGLVEQVLVSSDRRSVASGSSWDETWRIWDVAAGACVRVENRPADGRAPGAGGPWAASSAATGPREPGTASATVSPDGTRRAEYGAFGRTLTLVDARDATTISVLAKRSSARPVAGLSRLLGVTACSFSPDSRRLAAVADDATVTLWKAHDGALLGRFPLRAAGSCVAFVTGVDLVVGDTAGGVSLLRYEAR